jgi:hypothetical protein
MSFVNPNTWHLICNNFNLNFIFGIVCLCVCVCTFSLRRESSDMILGDKPLISEVVLSQLRLAALACCVNVGSRFPLISLCSSTLGSLCPINRPITNRGLTPLVSDRWRCCNDVACRLNPLLGQGHE